MTGQLIKVYISQENTYDQPLTWLQLTQSICFNYFQYDILQFRHFNLVQSQKSSIQLSITLSSKAIPRVLTQPIVCHLLWRYVSQLSHCNSQRDSKNVYKKPKRQQLNKEKATLTQQLSPFTQLFTFYMIAAFCRVNSLGIVVSIISVLNMFIRNLHKLSAKCMYQIIRIQTESSLTN